uniref:Uncharacterized protein n=1 Tax=Providencia rettgeri TaxID=587 RepID=A0A427HLH0_PRORE|nr:hypothetical protein [Providencia rettgeri]
MIRLKMRVDDLKILTKGLVNYISKKFSNMIFKIKNCNNSFPFLTRKRPEYIVGQDEKILKKLSVKQYH